jgi:hypothetical protein
MNAIKMKSRVGADGVLRIVVPMGQAEAEREVELTIEPVAATQSPDEDHLQFLRSTAGAWQGEFERPPQGGYESRDSFS